MSLTGSFLTILIVYNQDDQDLDIAIGEVYVCEYVIGSMSLASFINVLSLATSLYVKELRGKSK